MNAEFQRIIRRHKKAFLSGSIQRNRGKQQNGKGWNSLLENQRYQGKFYAKIGTIMDRNVMDLTQAETIKKRLAAVAHMSEPTRDVTFAACRDKKSDHSLVEKSQWEQLTQKA